MRDTFNDASWNRRYMASYYTSTLTQVCRLSGNTLDGAVSAANKRLEKEYTGLHSDRMAVHKIGAVEALVCDLESLLGVQP